MRADKLKCNTGSHFQKNVQQKTVKYKNVKTRFFCIAIFLAGGAGGVSIGSHHTAIYVYFLKSGI
jgi:hypothetical protein